MTPIISEVTDLSQADGSNADLLVVPTAPLP